MNITSTPPAPDIGEQVTIKAKQLQKNASQTSSVSDKQRKEAKKVSRDFEALFVGMMLKSMRETVTTKNSLTSSSRGEEIYRSLLDQEYAASAAKTGSIGLAKTIEKEIIRRESSKTGTMIDKHQ